MASAQALTSLLVVSLSSTAVVQGPPASCLPSAAHLNVAMAGQRLAERCCSAGACWAFCKGRKCCVILALALTS